MGCHVYEGVFFSLLITQTLERHFFSFFTNFEQFKGLWGHLLILDTLSSDPMKKGGLSEREVPDTLNVQPAATLP